MIKEILKEIVADELRSPCESKKQHGSHRKIVICQRGFVFAGVVDFEGAYLVISDAVNVRRWGTKRGLGELAATGNQPETKCDPAGVVRVHELSVVATMDCKDGVTINATA